MNRIKYTSILVFCTLYGFSSVAAVTYDPIEPATLLKKVGEYSGKFVKFQAKFSHITIKAEKLFSAPTGTKVNLADYDSFSVYGEGFVFQRMLISKKKDSGIYDLPSDTIVTIYGEVYRENMVGEPIILVHKIEKTIFGQTQELLPHERRELE